MAGKKIHIKLLLAGVLTGALLACNRQQPVAEQPRLPYYNGPDFTPVWITAGSDSINRVHRIAPFQFTDQLGHVVTRQTVNEKPYVANFFFTSCGSICPQMMKNLKRVLQRYPQVLILSHSVNPETDTVERLQWYARKMQISSPNWHLLTGPQGVTYTLARQSYFAEDEIGFNRDSTDFLHTEHLLLIDGQQHIRGVYNGTLQLETDRLSEDIGLLLK